MGVGVGVGESRAFEDASVFESQYFYFVEIA